MYSRLNGVPDRAKVYLFDIENVIIHDSAVDMCEAVDMSFGGSVVAVAHIAIMRALV